MEWLSYLLVLICPLMMIFCMRGHGNGHKHHEATDYKKNLDNTIKLLQEENNILRNEIDFLSELVKKES